jgi:hypothetical protein
VSTISPERIRRADPLADLEPTVAPEQLRRRVESIMAHTRPDDPPAKRRPRLPRRRLTGALVAATALVAAALASLPGDSSREGPEPGSAAAILQAAAAVAADQPKPPPLTGYRYTEWIQHWKWEPIVHEGKEVRPTQEVEQRVETWVDRDWNGRRVAHQGRVIQGDERTKRNYFVRAGEGRYEYGDGPRPPLEELPTDPQALRELLIAAHKDMRWQARTRVPCPGTDIDELDESSRKCFGRPRWAPGRPTPDQTHYEVTRRVLSLLGDSNTTPELRAALFGVLALTPGVRPAPDAKDALGRTGDAVAVPTRLDGGGGVITVIFDRDTSQMLFWSEHGTGGGTPDQDHTIVHAGRVANVGDRP